jgi:cytochrome c oxidase subunit 2
MEIHRYEKIWIGITIAAIILMLAAISLASFGLGLQLPGDAGAVDPAKLAQTPPFDKPGVYQITEGKYQVVMVAFAWAYNPNEIKVPAGSQVTFKITSRDITHGIYIEKTNINLMILPGQISEATVTFKDPGEYLFLCHEYCGVGHQAMAGKVIVEPKP